jgi:RHS repeat-associated protein
MKKLEWIVLMAGMLLWVGHADAYTNDCANDEPPPECPADAPIPECPTCVTLTPAPEPCPDSDSEGSSIKPSRANKKRSVTDLTVFGPVPIPFTRIYNSRTLDWTTNYMEFGWKQTWQHNWNFEMRDMTTYSMGRKDVKLRYSTGAEFNFKAVEETNGVVIRSPLAYNGDRLYEWTGTNVGHTLVTSGGWEYDFRRTTAPRYQLLQVRNGKGAAWNLSYDADGRVQRIENNFGRWLEIERTNVNDRLCITGIHSSDGRDVSYDYDEWVAVIVTTSIVKHVTCVTNEWSSSGGGSINIVVCNTNWTTNVTTSISTNNLLTGVDYPDGSHATYTYAGSQCLTDGRPLLATARDPMHPGSGARIRLVYNYDFILNFGNGPYLVTGVAKEERNLDTDELVVQLPTGAGQYPQVLLGNGVEVTHKYNNGLLVERSDGEGRPTYYTRDQDGAGFVASIADAESNTTTFVRDYAGRILQQVDPLGHTNGFSYNAAGFLLSKTDPLGRTTIYTPDTNNWLSRVDYPDASFEEWTRNEQGQPLTQRLRNGGGVAYEYYGTNETGGCFGDLKTITDPMSNITAYAWNSAGLPVSITDARTNITLFAYDWRGQMLSITNADTSAVSFQYDTFGNRTNRVDELGRETVFTYDQFNRVHTVRDPLGRVTTLEYGRLPGCTGCGVFDESITRITDPSGKITEYAYDRSGKRTNEILAAGTSEAAPTAWTYDVVGRKKTQLDANGNLHTWFYDAASQMVAESNAAGEVTIYAYDAAGNLTNRLDGAGIETLVECDAMNRPVALGSGTLRYEYAYDLGGRRTSMCTRVNGAITESTSYSHDLNDRLVAKIDPSEYMLAYEYDSVGHRSRFSISNVLDVSYAYDLRNRLVEIVGNGKVTQFGYDVTGYRTNAVWPNGTLATYDYDDAGQLLSLVHDRAGSPNPPIASSAYAYDPSGNRTNMLTLEDTNSYAYDARNWLTSAAYPDGKEEAFTYDPVGNRIHLGGAISIPTDYVYGPVNRLLSSSSPAETNIYTFDSAGRLVGQTVNDLPRAYGYDFLSRMTSLTDTNGSTFSFAFDGEGNRICQSLNNCLSTRFVYDGPNVVLELNASNQVAWAYVNGPGVDQPIERISFINGTPRQRQVFHADGLGSIVALTDESGGVIQTYAYAAFGSIRAQTSTNLNRIAFTAREALGDSLGFYYYRNRVLDPSTGRFTSEDPRGYINGPNWYVYVINNPINWFDPWGLEVDPGEVDVNHDGVADGKIGDWGNIFNGSGGRCMSGGSGGGGGGGGGGGKGFKGGKQNVRDRDFGIKDKGFWDWFHRSPNGKKSMGELGCKDDADKAHKDYKDTGGH